MAFSILPVRRNLRFKLNPAKALDWHGDGFHVSQFLNTMSLFFPVGERFFIDAVRMFRDDVTDPELKKAVTAFIGQEAMHGREHDEYNEFVNQLGVPVAAQEQLVAGLLKHINKHWPKDLNLAGTVALEHLTAILGGALLETPEFMEGADEHYAALWNWHAIEETEHKAVVFEVYQTVFGTDKNLYSYGLRTFALVLATSIFFALLVPFYLHNVRVKGQLFNLKGWRSLLSATWGRKGIYRRATLPWFDWFKPGFHPWDHNNQDQLQRYEELVGRVLRDMEQKLAA